MLVQKNLCCSNQNLIVTTSNFWWLNKSSLVHWLHIFFKQPRFGWFCWFNKISWLVQQNFSCPNQILVVSIKVLLSQPILLQCSSWPISYWPSAQITFWKSNLSEFNWILINYLLNFSKFNTSLDLFPIIFWLFIFLWYLAYYL